MYTDLMIDLETYGIAHDAAIIQIAAIPFNFATGEMAPPLGVFDRRVELMSSIAAGATIQQSTIDWWKTQDLELHKLVTSGTESIAYVLQMLNEFITDNLKAGGSIWSHATFDPVVLTSAFKNSDITTKFKYWQPKDLRTLEYLAGNPPKPKFVGAQHNALDDCWNQILYVEVCRKAIEAKYTRTHEGNGVYSTEIAAKDMN